MALIGQKNVLETVNKLIEGGFPRFTMIVGGRGSGKTTLTKQICKMLQMKLVAIETNVDAVREVITNSYHNTEPIVYVLTDTDKMSVAAKNALLKVTEEPPQKAYFIQTVTDLSNSLPTLVSRACVIHMEEYTGEQLEQYLNYKYPQHGLSPEVAEFVWSVAKVPLDIDILMTYDVKEFMDFVNMVTDNLHTVSSANAFKLQSKLALKKDEDRWDVLLFLQALREQFFYKYLYTDQIPFFESYRLVCNTIKEIQTKNSVNKQYCLDQMILGIRSFWRQV